MVELVLRAQGRSLPLEITLTATFAATLLVTESLEVSAVHPQLWHPHLGRIDFGCDLETHGHLRVLSGLLSAVCIELTGDG